MFVAPPAAPQAIALYDSSDVIEIELWSVTCIDENGLEFNCNINVTNATAVPSPHFEIAGKGPDRCMSVVTDVSWLHSTNFFTISKELCVKFNNTVLIKCLPDPNL